MGLMNVLWDTKGDKIVSPSTEILASFYSRLLYISNKMEGKIVSGSEDWTKSAGGIPPH